MNIKTIFTKKESDYEILTDKTIFQKVIQYLFNYVNDVKIMDRTSFSEFGMTTYVGRQGSGKTMSMVEHLERYRKKYPDIKILTNFGYIHEDEPLTDWQQLIDVRNEAGIVFAIDEIQNEFDVYESRNFNLEILKVITQQRKQGIKILASSQVFTRVSKPLREQTYEVVECHTVGGRWTFQKCFDADEYNMFIDSNDPEKKFKVPRKYRKSFVQTNKIRNLYDSYAVINSMKKIIKNKK